MGEHLRKRLDENFIQSILQKYAAKELSVTQVLRILGIHRSQFFTLLNQWKANGGHLPLAHRRPAVRRIDAALEALILEELAKEKRLIDDAEIPVRMYNYSYVRDQIYRLSGRTVSVPTIIGRAKEHHYYLPKKIRVPHDREVLTNYPGELIQHDSSFHRFSPYVEKKWYLITSVDDFSRYMLYAKLLERESSWAHISALERVILTFGIPLAYYVDCHSIFRFVQGRDSVWREHKKLTDQVTPQWKQVLEDLHVKVTYALSPQAKGKVERPYRWLQDRLVRTCARENIRKIDEAQEILNYEIDRYNSKQVHSTIKEIPAIRFDRALATNRTMFRMFSLPSPYESTKDIFCLRLEKTVDAYHKVHLNTLALRVRGVPLREKVEIRIVPDEQSGLSELRFWHNRKLVVQKVKNSDLDGVQF
jgi:transposase-like protein